MVDRSRGLLSRTPPLLARAIVLRPAIAADLPALLAIRDAAGADALSDPAPITKASLARLIAANAVIVSDDDGQAVGFAAAEGATIHLLVDTAARSRGIGRELLAAICAGIRQAGHEAALLSLPPDSDAARHYRAAGWAEIGGSGRGGTVFQKPL
jgi:ribosomal protein S18 acetylase RimI-like enzyme